MDELRLAKLTEEFVSKIRRGDTPDPEEYAVRYPQLAERIRELFPTLIMLENAAGAKDARLTHKEILSAGTVFGAYHIQRELGRGGMGIVYEAVQVATRKRVALKILPFQTSLDTRRLERFVRETRITAELKHPNIIPIFDTGQVGDTAYFAMRYIEGNGLDHILRLMQQPSSTSSNASQTLRDSTSGGKINGLSNSDTEAARRTRAGLPEHFADYLEWVAKLGIQAASGLAYAHGRNLIHRDIKPSNLLLDKNETLWIADFGLARNIEDTTLTATGVLLGTPRYMSPEQAEAATQRVDHRSDIYSLGVTLYELITCRPVFEGKTPREILFQILTRTPIAPRRLNRAIPKDMERIVMKAMAKRPENRYQSAEDLANDLRHWLKKEPVKARRGNPVRFNPDQFRSKFSFAAIAVSLILALTMFGGWYYQEKTRDQSLKEVAGENNELNVVSTNSASKSNDEKDLTTLASSQSTISGELPQDGNSHPVSPDTGQTDGIRSLIATSLQLLSEILGTQNAAGNGSTSGQTSNSSTSQQDDTSYSGISLKLTRSNTTNCNKQ